MNVLETERLYLRQLNKSDFGNLCKILQDRETMYAYEGPFTDEEVSIWLNKQLGHYESWGFGLWAVCLKESGEFIGQCGLTYQSFLEQRVLEVGYLFRKDFWHKGYATEAAKACKEYAFSNLGEEEVFSIIRDTNIPSQNVAIRNGMAVKQKFIKHYRGVEMPHLVYSCKNREVLNGQNNN